MRRFHNREDATHVNCQPIWLSPSIKINGKVALNEKWQEKGIFSINDIMKTYGNGLMSVEELVTSLIFNRFSYLF
jgi:hypothetical protein